MNWYKVAILHEDVISNPDEFGGTSDPQQYKAWQYYSIGQEEETADQSICWIYKNGRLLTKTGPTTHLRSFGPNSLRYFRGYFDPVQKMLSIAVPQDKYERLKICVECDLSDVPDDILNALYNRFGHDYQIKVF